MGLLEVGELPKVTRGPGRKPGKWRGHEDTAEELRRLRSRQKNPDKAWGKVAERENATKAQAIVSAIKKGEAVGFETSAKGSFEAKSRKSPDQSGAPVARNGQVGILYDVWARFNPKK